MSQFSKVISQSVKGALMLSPQMFNKSYYKEYKNYQKVGSKTLNFISKSQLFTGAFVSGLYLECQRENKDSLELEDSTLLSIIKKYLALDSSLVVYAQKCRDDIILPLDDELEDSECISDPAQVMQKYVKEITIAYEKAIKLLDDYYCKVETMMNRCSEGCIDQDLWEEIESAATEKYEAECMLKDLVRRLEKTCGPEANSVKASLKHYEERYQELKERADTAGKFWYKLTKGRNTFVAEMEALFPYTNVEKGVFCAKGGDIDSLLLIATKKICQLQNEIAKVDCDLHRQVNRCLENQVDDKTLQDKMDAELQKLKMELDKLYEKKLSEACDITQNELTARLKLGEIEYEKNLHKTLIEQTEKVLSEERCKQAEYLERQKQRIALKMKDVQEKLSKLDLTLKARSDADHMSQQAQQLWIATEELDEALKGRNIREKDVRTCVSKELEAIRDSSADCDDLVRAVLSGITTTVKTKGIFTEAVLKEQFKTVEKACRDFALVPSDNKGLHVIALSRLASWIVPRPTVIAKGDDSLNNYELIEKVRKHINEGQWDKVYYYMSLVTGGARDVAEEWLQEVALHLQVRLACDAIQIHAANMGLLTQ